MGNCKLCGEPAGLFRDLHDACVEEAQVKARLEDQTRQEILAAISRTFQGGLEYEDLWENAKRLCRNSSMMLSLPSVFIEGWEKEAERYLSDDELSESEEVALGNFKEFYGFTTEQLDKNGVFSRVIKAGILRELFSGQVPDRISVSGNFPFNLNKQEQLVWVFEDCHYLEDKSKRRYEGRTGGVSFRVISGVYLRTGSFSGHPIDYTERSFVGTGTLALTTQNVYFSCESTSLRIPLKKIVSHQAFDDGVGIIRDAANARNEVFVTGDGWFAYNLLTGLCKLQ